MQSGQQGESQYRSVGPRQAVGDGQHDPVVSAGRGHPLLGGRDGIPPPSHSPDTLPPLVGQGVIDQQCDATEAGQVGENEDADVVS